MVLLIRECSGIVCLTDEKMKRLGLPMMVEKFEKLEEMRLKYVERTREGWYASIAYRFSEMFEAGFYFSEYDPDRDGYEAARNADMAENTGVEPDDPKEYESTEFCASLRIDLNEYWTIKFEAHQFNGTAVLIDQDQVSLSANDTDFDYQVYITKCSLNF